VEGSGGGLIYDKEFRDPASEDPISGHYLSPGHPEREGVPTIRTGRKVFAKIGTNLLILLQKD
jgi:hypothetical protein